MSVRLITPGDFSKGFMELINTFTLNPISITYDDFQSNLEKISIQGGSILVIEEHGQIIATCKVLVEQKLHNNCKSVGHIEDVVVHPSFRQKGYATQLIEHAIEHCKQTNCYKVILDCKEEYFRVYEKCGFQKRGIAAAKYL